MTPEDQLFHLQQQHRLLVAKADERAIEAWRENFPQDVHDKVKFFTQRRAQKRAEKAAKRERKAFVYAQLHGECTIASDDERWDDLWSSTDEGTTDEDDYALFSLSLRLCAQFNFYFPFSL